MNLNFIEKTNRNNLIEFFPELKNLKDIAENNICHNNESVFNHTMQVFDNCKLLINKLNKEQKMYFNRILTENKIKNLFLLGVLFHDIGKIKTIKTENNLTFCANHENAGLKLLGQTQINKLSGPEYTYIESIIKNHSLIQVCLDKRGSFEEEYSKLKNNYPNIILELTILGIADIYQGDLRKNNREEYEYRIEKLSDKMKTV